MRLWYINTKESDYLQDLLYSGFVARLGKENILDIPFNTKYHFPTRKVYPRNLGYQPQKIWSRLFSTYDRPDCVVVGSSSPKCFLKYKLMQNLIPDSTPIIFLDGGDEPSIGGDLKRLGNKSIFEEVTRVRPFDLIFKREKILSHEYPKNVFPLPFCARMDVYDKIHVSEFKYDVTFWAVESHPIRTKVLDLLKDRFDCLKNGTTRNQIFKKYKRKGVFYLEELQKSKVTLNFRGAGWDTLRYWEVPALGRFMLTQKPQIEIPNDYVEGEHVAYVADDLSDLIDKCQFYLDNENLRTQISNNALQHTQKFHTHLHRADYVLSHIKNLISKRS